MVAIASLPGGPIYAHVLEGKGGTATDWTGCTVAVETDVMPSFAHAWVQAGKLAMTVIPPDQQFCFLIDDAWEHPGIHYQSIKRALRRYTRLAPAEIFAVFLGSPVAGKSLAWVRVGISDPRIAATFKLIYR
jgi:hypothetical protein